MSTHTTPGTEITLSFDNGPDPDVTPPVLDVLKRTGVLSSFFVLGDKMRDRRRIVARAHEEGHWIGNHTFNHLVPLGEARDPNAPAREIGETQELLGDLAHERRFFRPFGGGGHLDRRLLSQAALSYLIGGRYTCVLWNVIPKDWIEPDTWVERAIDECFANTRSLVVLHDISTGAMAHLERFIDVARTRGATFLQEFPAECVPLQRGALTRPMDFCVASGG